MHIVDEVPELDGADRRLTDGAGRSTGSSTPATRRRARSSTSSDLSEGRVVATFDVDQFHDYRARRPPMSFVRDHYEAYDAPRLVVRLLRDTGGTPYLLLHGPEPDNRWEAFARRRASRWSSGSASPGSCRMGSVPMAVPHTRPIAITHHANNPELLTGESPWRGELRIPSQRAGAARAAAGGVGPRRDGLRRPHPALPRPARVPGGVDRAARARRARRPADRRPVRPAAPRPRTARPRSRATSPPTRRSATSSPRSSSSTTPSSVPRSPGTSLLAADQPLPTGEEIGQQFEQFLAGLDGPTTTPTSRRRGAGAGSAEALVDAARPRAHRQQPVPRPAAGHRPAAGLRRPGRGAGAGRRRPHRRPGVRRALAALLLPAARRHRGPDRLRRRAAARRPLLRHPAGRGPPARPPDLLPDRQLPAGRRRASSTRTDARRARARGGPRHGRPDARAAATRTPTRWPRSGPRSTRATSATPGSACRTIRDHPSRARMWIRVGDGLGDDPQIHLAAFTYASDIGAAGRRPWPPHDVHAGRTSRWPRSTTPSGSTGRSGPTTGGSTTSSRPSAPGRPRPGPGPGLRAGRPAGRDRGPGGPDPAPPRPSDRRLGRRDFVNYTDVVSRQTAPKRRYGGRVLWRLSPREVAVTAACDRAVLRGGCCRDPAGGRRPPSGESAALECPRRPRRPAHGRAARPPSRCRSRAARRGPGTTRDSHSPSRYSIDWNRPDDVDDPVVAAAPGVVVRGRAARHERLRPLGHARARLGRADHLRPPDRRRRRPGPDASTRARCSGRSASTGNSFGTHLHFEERTSGGAVLAPYFDGVAFVFGSTLASQNCLDVPLAGNFLGGPEAELVVYRRASEVHVPGPAAGTDAARCSGSAGPPTSRSSGDWDGDGLANPGVRAPATHAASGCGRRRRHADRASARRGTCRWPATGTATVAGRSAYGGRHGTFVLRAADGTTTSVALGDRDDLPVTGDWNGDGRTDLGVYDQATATFTLRVVDADGLAWTAQVPFGQPGDLPVTGDWDGNLHAPTSGSGTRPPPPSPSAAPRRRPRPAPHHAPRSSAPLADARPLTVCAVGERPFRTTRAAASIGP